MAKTSNNKPLNIFFDTLGCAKNIVDTSKMQDALQKCGYYIVDEAKIADIIILNTCAFIEAACQESIDTFFEYRNFYKNKKIIVCGCLVSRYAKDLEESLNEADAFISCADEDKICDLIASFKITSNNNPKAQDNLTSAFAYVKISDGCNRRCSYCTIPFIRGKYISSSCEQICEDVAFQESLGVKEIILVAQDCGVWGIDLKDKNLAWLVNNLCKKFPTINFRLLYVYPETISDDLIDAFKNNKNLVNYIDMPMQHCASQVLKNMGRRGCKDTFVELICKLRREIPDITLRSTFICGFPGERDEEFEELCEFVQDIKLDYLGCFEYSQEEGTKAANMKCQISPSEKYSRTNRLREIADVISLGKLENRLGKSFDVLIEGVEEGRFYGRASFQAPEIDGVVFISEFNEKKIKTGDYLNVKIVDTEGYDLVGVINDQ